MADLFEQAKAGRRGVIVIRSGSPAIGSVRLRQKPGEEQRPAFSWKEAGMVMLRNRTEKPKRRR